MQTIPVKRIETLREVYRKFGDMDVGILSPTGADRITRLSTIPPKNAFSAIQGFSFCRSDDCFLLAVRDYYFCSNTNTGQERIMGNVQCARDLEFTGDSNMCLFVNEKEPFPCIICQSTECKLCKNKTDKQRSRFEEISQFVKQHDENRNDAIEFDSTRREPTEAGVPSQGYEVPGRVNLENRDPESSNS